MNEVKAIECKNWIKKAKEKGYEIYKEESWTSQ